eukprot:6801283-Pyramimonas_sp.AAC.1
MSRNPGSRGNPRNTKEVWGTGKVGSRDTNLQPRKHSFGKPNTGVLTSGAWLLELEGKKTGATLVVRRFPKT